MFSAVILQGLLFFHFGFSSFLYLIHFLDIYVMVSAIEADFRKKLKITVFQMLLELY